MRLKRWKTNPWNAFVPGIGSGVRLFLQRDPDRHGFQVPSPLGSWSRNNGTIFTHELRDRHAMLATLFTRQRHGGHVW